MGDAIVIAGLAIEVVDASVLPRALLLSPADVKNLSKRTPEAADRR